MSNWFVVGMGIGTVFVGLIVIIVFCKIMSLFCRAFTPKVKPEEKAETLQNVPETENRQELLAAISAVIAEELGTDISAIRIHSFKKI